MISLKNVSKFYYHKGIISSGITKINLQLDMGEFVVITGESGSGKSTLLNVISGLDTYEEGEMYIDGRETSHFMEKDFADYRKKYIGNIFQNFNLVNSYTVYQNVELILRINGYSRQETKKRVDDILSRVGLTKYANSKASKLSGGQKQRVAIARALAKETNIIVADEPTGNLDSESATEIVKLLSEISKHKLVVVVTHNYDLFAPYVTRKIKMHDGKIAEDIRVNEREAFVNAGENDLQCEADDKQKKNKKTRGSHYKPRPVKLSAGSKLRLGLRNTFNVFPKFILLLIVFVFVATAVSSQYSAYLQQKEEASRMGYNNLFQNMSLDRIVVKKNDDSKFTVKDYEELKKLDNVRTVAEYDVLLDSTLYLEDEDMSYDVAPRSIDEFKGKLVMGRMPKADGEIILEGDSDEFDLRSKEEMTRTMKQKFTASYGVNNRQFNFKVVGIAYKETKNDASYICNAYMSEKYMNWLLIEAYRMNTNLTVTLNKDEKNVTPYDTNYNLRACRNVNKGEIFVPEEAKDYYKDGKCVGQEMTVKTKNIFATKTGNFKISKTYTDKTYTKISGFNDYDEYMGIMLVNPEDYNNMFSKNNYQSTVYVNSVDAIKETKAALEAKGFVALPLRDTIINALSDIMNLIQLPVVFIVVLALFFIAYFVIRLILKSRNSYFSILRMLGTDKRSIRRIMDVELLTVVTIAFGIFMAVAIMAKTGIIHVEYISNLVKFLKPVHYGMLYAVLLVMSYLISGKFSRSLFKRSALGTFREVE